VAILELIHANVTPTGDGRGAFIRSKTNRLVRVRARTRRHLR
jgi:hypothetical protein